MSTTQYTYDHVETMYHKAQSLALKISLNAVKHSGQKKVESLSSFGFGEIAMLCDKYGCDKGSLDWNSPHPYKWLPHTYAWIYEALLAPKRDLVRHIFECGIGSPNDPQTAASPDIRQQIPAGASMRVWRDYFPKAEIYAGDIDRDVLFEEERLHTGYIDQLNPEAIEGFFKEQQVQSYELMIDDGLHTAEAAITLFSHAHPYLSADGFYFIEDMPEAYLLTLHESLKPYRKDFDIEFLCMNMPVSPDNNLIVIRRK